MKKLALLLPLLFTSSAFAENSNQNFLASLNLGIANGDKVISDEKLADGDLMIGYDLAYQYKFNDKWGVEVGYRHSEPEGTFAALKAISSLFVGTLELDYANSIRAAAVYTHSFSDNNKFDFKLGVQRYNVKSTLKGYVPVPVIGGEEQPINTISVSDDGTGLYAGLGWRYQFDSGFALGASLDHQDMDVLNVTSLNLSLGFHF